MAFSQSGYQSCRTVIQLLPNDLRIYSGWQAPSIIIITTAINRGLPPPGTIETNMDLALARRWMLGVVGDAGGGGSVRYDGSLYMPQPLAYTNPQ